MRTRRGFARHFVLLGATFATGLLVGGAVVGVRTAPARGIGDCHAVSEAEVRAIVTQLRGRAGAREQDQGEYRHVNFRGRILRGDLRDRIFTECDFRGADLRGVDFTGSGFSWSDLRGARLDGANLTGVLYTAGTRWPAGFDPEAHGARLDE